MNFTDTTAMAFTDMALTIAGAFALSSPRGFEEELRGIVPDGLHVSASLDGDEVTVIVIDGVGQLAPFCMRKFPLASRDHVAAGLLIRTMRKWVEKAAEAMCEFPERFVPCPAAIAHRDVLTFVRPQGDSA